MNYKIQLTLFYACLYLYFLMNASILSDEISAIRSATKSSFQFHHAIFSKSSICFYENLYLITFAGTPPTILFVGTFLSQLSLLKLLLRCQSLLPTKKFLHLYQSYIVSDMEFRIFHSMATNFWNVCI